MGNPLFPLLAKEESLIMRSSANIVVVLPPRNPRALYEEIKHFRNDGAIEYYARTFGMRRAEAEQHFDEMLKFLSIARFHSDQVTPSDQLDEMWHAMIIQTEAYQGLCDRLGGFIHHSTTGAPQRDAYLNAVGIYKSEFGMPHRVWLDPKRKYADQSTYSNDGADCEGCRVVGWCSCHS